MEVIKSQKISIFEVLGYIFCPRIIYYENVLKMFGEKKEDSNKEEEERVKGKNRINRKWIWDRLKLKKQSIEKMMNSNQENILYWYNREFNKELSSERYHFYGKLDDILLLEDETIVPVYYYNAKYTAREENRYKYIVAMFLILIEEEYKIKSQKGYILFLDGLSLKKIECTSKDLEKVKESAAEVLKIIETERYPIEAEGGTKCRDCYYKKICGR